jgi:hypothetical protein
MRIRIDSDPRLHIAIELGHMVSLCGVRAKVKWRNVHHGAVSELCEECTLLSEQKKSPPSR